MRFYSFARVIVRIFLKIAFSIRFEGLEYLPPKGVGYILCSNHRSYMDPLLVGVRIPAQLKFMAKEELFRNRAFGWLIRKLGAFPVARGKGDSGAIDFAVESVASGGALLIFPEGTRSKDGTLRKLKSGVLVIASQAKAPVLPVVILFEGKLRFRSKVIIRYGEMIPCSELELDGMDAGKLRIAKHKLTRTMERLMQGDSNEAH